MNDSDRSSDGATETFQQPPEHRPVPYVGVLADEPQHHVDADQGPRAADARAAVRDDGARLVDVPHVGDEGEQVGGLRGRAVVGPARVVQVSDPLDLVGLGRKGHKGFRPSYGCTSSTQRKRALRTHYVLVDPSCVPRKGLTCASQICFPCVEATQQQGL